MLVTVWSRHNDQKFNSVSNLGNYIIKVIFLLFDQDRMNIKVVNARIHEKGDGM